MRKISLLIVLLFSVLCTNAQSNNSKKEKAPKSISFIEMHRTGCYGTCPIYKIEITKAGLLTYNAIRYNNDTGIFTKNIGEKAASKIMKQAMTLRIDTCADEFKMDITDLPGMILTIKYNNYTKVIRNANYGAYVLKQLSSKLDELKGNGIDGTWQKKTMPEKK